MADLRVVLRAERVHGDCDDDQEDEGTPDPETSPQAASKPGRDPGREEQQQADVGEGQAPARKVEQGPDTLGLALGSQAHGGYRRGAVTQDEGEPSRDVQEDEPRIEVHQDASLDAASEPACDADGGRSAVPCCCHAADDRAIHSDAVKMAIAFTGCSAATIGASARSATNTDCSANSTI